MVGEGGAAEDKDDDGAEGVVEEGGVEKGAVESGVDGASVNEGGKDGAATTSATKIGELRKRDRRGERRRCGKRE